MYRHNVLGTRNVAWLSLEFGAPLALASSLAVHHLDPAFGCDLAWVGHVDSALRAERQVTAARSLGLSASVLRLPCPETETDASCPDQPRGDAAALLARALAAWTMLPTPSRRPLYTLTGRARDPPWPYVPHFLAASFALVLEAVGEAAGAEREPVLTMEHAAGWACAWPDPAPAIWAAHAAELGYSTPT